MTWAYRSVGSEEPRALAGRPPATFLAVSNTAFPRFRVIMSNQAAVAVDAGSPGPGRCGFPAA
jgi:hypothetical protein